MGGLQTRGEVSILVLKLAALAAVAAVALWYLAAPPKGEAGYRERAAAVAETLSSQVETARIWAETVDQGRTTSVAAGVGLEEAEQDAAGAASGFAAYEPPAGTLELRSELISLSNRVNDALAGIRIGIQQDPPEGLAGLAAPLPELAVELRRFEERVEP